MKQNLRHCKPRFLFYRGSFSQSLGPLDSGFHSIVDYLLEAVSMRLGFHFIGVEGEASVGNNIVNAV